MVGYQRIEEAVVGQLLRHFPDHLNTNRCKASDIDAVFLAMRNEDADFGCVIDYGDGRRRDRPPFGSDIWVWQIIGFFLVRFRGDTADQDRKTREVIDRLTTLFNEDKRLNGLVPLIQVTQISQPEPEMINEMPVYWLAFSIEALDK